MEINECVVSRIDKVQKRRRLFSVKKKQMAKESDFKTLIKTSAVVYDKITSKPVLLYLTARDHGLNLQRLMGPSGIMTEKPSGATPRQSGLSGPTRVFGYMPRKRGRQDWCRVTAFNRRSPELAMMLEETAASLAPFYKECVPDLYEYHMSKAGGILDDYRMGSSCNPWTSGIINYNWAIPYHHDFGNIKRGWSAMITHKRDCKGGYLSVPEYGLGFELSDCSVLYFDGQGSLHGVTPVNIQTRNGYRCTTVFYSLNELWICKSPEEEVKRFRKIRTEKEYARKEFPNSRSPTADYRKRHGEK